MIESLLLKQHSVGDPFASQVVLNMSMNGTNGSTTFSDTKGHMFTRVGAAIISTSQYKSGGSSAYFSGGSYISTPSNASIENWAQDYTIEFWMRPDSVAISYQEMIAKGGGIQIYLAGDRISIALSSTNSTTYFLNVVSTSVSINAWYHVALVHSGAKYTLYVNGIGTLLATTTVNANTGTSALYVSTYMGSYPFYGYLDEVRITMAARYLSNFTPTSSYC